MPFLPLLKDSLLPVMLAGLLGASLPVLLHFTLPVGAWRVLAVLMATLLCFLPACWFIALTGGERQFALRAICRNKSRSDE